MKTIFFLVIALLPVLKLNSQEHLRIFEDTLNETPLLRISSMNYYGSNRFNNQFMDKFLFGGNIDQALKDNNLNRLKSANSIGAEAEQRIDSYTPTINPFKKEKYGLMLSFSDNHFLSASIPKDVYAVAMYGNASYVGDTADLSFAHAQYQHYQKFSAGFYEQKTMSSIQLSFITGSKGFDFYSSGSFLSTNAALDTVELSLRGQGFSTDRFSPYWAFQGTGFCLDLSYNFIFASKQGKQQIVNFRVGNVGAIFWNKNSKNFTVDSTTIYTGFDVKDFIGQDSINDSWNFEDTLGILKRIGRYGEALPLELSIDKLADIRGNKVQAIFGFKAILTQDYRPYVYGGVYYQPNAAFSGSTYLSYGGFAGIRWGLYLNYRVQDKIFLSLGTADMIGNISKNYGFGRSANLLATFKL
ncbi:MAG: hypothetical protein HYZ14_11735 [Bacteroidetes bacterium]|nr:hypothetical protein [Bacteroidota bacterium]